MVGQLRPDYLTEGRVQGPAAVVRFGRSSAKCRRKKGIGESHQEQLSIPEKSEVQITFVRDVPFYDEHVCNVRLQEDLP